MLRTCLLRSAGSDAVLPPIVVESAYGRRVLRICGCDITSEDAATLIGLLWDDVTLASDESAAAIAFARDADQPIEALDPDIRDAIVHVLEHGGATGSLVALRDALARGCC